MNKASEANSSFLLPEQKYDMVFGRKKFLENSKTIQIITSWKTQWNYESH